MENTSVPTSVAFKMDGEASVNVVKAHPPATALERVETMILTASSVRIKQNLYPSARPLSFMQRLILRWGKRRQRCRNGNKFESIRNLNKAMEGWEELRLKMKSGVRHDDYVDFEKKEISAFEELMAEVEVKEREIRDEAAVGRER